MRRLRLPKDRVVIETVGAYIAQADSASPSFTLPYYRTLVRQLITLEDQKFYWLNCYSIEEGGSQNATPELAIRAIDAELERR